MALPRAARSSVRQLVAVHLMDPGGFLTSLSRFVPEIMQ
jgi:hypothetical protein